MERLLEELNNTYLSGHTQNVSAAIYENIEAPWPYYAANYPFLLDLPRNARILEIGSGSGSLLAWLASQGFTNLRGLDSSPEEVLKANERGIPLIRANAHSYLEGAASGSIDVIIGKAVFEHMQKQDGADMVKLATKALNPDNGMLILDVPNMDWLLSNHERYMDLTHHVGYTRESMNQMLSLYFNQVEVRGSREPGTSKRSRIRVALVKPLAVKMLRLFLRVMGEGASNVLFESRSIIAVAKN